MNSLLAFAKDAPRARRAQLDLDPQAYVAHLGPNAPKPWVLWRPERLQYYLPVANMIEWARQQGYAMPPIPWTFRAQNRSLVYLSAYVFALLRWCKHVAGWMVHPWVSRHPGSR